VSSPPYLRTEIDPDSERLCFLVFKIPDAVPSLATIEFECYTKSSKPFKNYNVHMEEERQIS
jgi:hypothetical protein